MGFEPHGSNGATSMPCSSSGFRSGAVVGFRSGAVVGFRSGAVVGFRSSHASDQRSTAWPSRASRRSSARSARRPRQRSACSASRRFSACRAPVGRGAWSRRGEHLHAARGVRVLGRPRRRGRRTVLETFRLRRGCLRVVKLGRRRPHELFTALGCAVHRRFRRDHDAVDGRKEIRIVHRAVVSTCMRKEIRIVHRAVVSTCMRKEIRIVPRRRRRLGLRTWRPVEGHPLWEMEQGQHPAGGHAAGAHGSAADARRRGRLRG